MPDCQDAMFWDHPRICGEHLWMAVWGRFVRGSSPHMRGALILARRIIVSHGIIPAYAGSTSLAAPSVFRAMDHPRICGEHT